MIKFTVPVRTKNPLNGAQGRSRAAIFAKAARRKKERTAAEFCTRAACGRAIEIVAIDARTVALRRVSPRPLDGDGLQAALKSVRDGIADALQIDDGTDSVTWIYDWRRGKVREYAVEVEICGNQEQTREALL